ncbi:MAG: glycine cleavage system protein H, partial [Actinobacteria bacterium]|nr:glycine cleavage system protein H [Actinomycetota bacterium]
MYPEDLRYTREHEWARKDGANIRVGITFYA